MPNENEIELKPCPFCNGEATYNFDSRDDSHQVLCENDCRTTCFIENFEAESKAEVFQLWNTRAADKQISELELEIARRDEILNNALWLELPGGIIIYPKGTAKNSTSPECVFRDKSGEWDVLYAETVLEAFDALKETGKGESDGNEKRNSGKLF